MNETLNVVKSSFEKLPPNHDEKQHDFKRYIFFEYFKYVVRK